MEQPLSSGQNLICAAFWTLVLFDAFGRFAAFFFCYLYFNLFDLFLFFLVLLTRPCLLSLSLYYSSLILRT